MSYKHATKFSFGNDVWHKVTGDHGIVFGFELRENSMTQYHVVFDDSRKENLCYESELLSEPKTTTEIPQ